MAFQKGNKINLGRKATDETKAKMSESRKGRKAWNKGIPHTEEAKKKMSESAPKSKPEGFGLKVAIANSERIWTEEMKLKHSGENCNFWKGGISHINKLIRASAEYKSWRTLVFKRDNYSCQTCGSHKNLHAHHIKEFAKYPELRYEIDNGQTLCQIHHSEVHGRPIPNIGSVNKKVGKRRIAS